MKRLLNVAIFTMVFVVTTQGQITIGSELEPSKAALLDLKTQEPDSDNVTSTAGGIVLPRVKLVDKYTLQPFIPLDDSEWVADSADVKKKHTGLIVYNVNTTAPFVEGLHIWNGTEWGFSLTIDPKIGQPLPAVMTFVQSTASYEFATGDGPDKNKTESSTSSKFESTFNYGQKVIVPFAANDIVLNNGLTDFANNIFTLKKNGAVEISGYLNYFCGTEGSTEVLLNVILQVKKTTSSQWEDYAIGRTVLANPQQWYRNQIIIPPALYEGKIGDQIRMVIARPYNISGTTATFLGAKHGEDNSHKAAITVPYGAKFSRGLKIIAQ